MTISVFGIRHHGPGSAKSLLKALEQMEPDCILIEGPPEANEIISLASHETMKPPVAILVYLPDNPKKAVVYPFAVFSPEWQAIQFGLKNNIPVSFIDLPQYYQLKAIDEESVLINDEQESKAMADPFSILAQISGYSDGEMWWDNFVENRSTDLQIFPAMAEIITELRKELKRPFEKRENQREAYMRKMLKKAEKDGYKKIAVVCGAWHVPALNNKFSNEDEKILKDLKKTKTKSTWIPWTHSRLSFYSGYGAGIESPGWYYHLWTVKENVVINWFAKVSNLLREKDIDVSSAHLIEAARLAEALAIIRDKHLVGLTELNEATKSVICFGSDIPLKLIADKLIVGYELGEVPTGTPMTPIQQDFLSLLKSYRLKTELNIKEINLDLRKENDLDKSYLLHRLIILDINWGKLKLNPLNKKGSFHEIWDLEWKPEFFIQMVEAGIWGNTIYDAANSYAINRAKNAANLAELTSLLEIALLANIPDALEKIMMKLQEESSLSTDIEQLMSSVPPMVNVMRYGNVRKTDSEMVKKVLDGLVFRICIGLPNACSSINYEVSVLILNKIIKFNDALRLLQDQEYLGIWYKTLSQLSEMENINGVISGYSCRLLFDNQILEMEVLETKISFALSVTSDIGNASNWLEGFLKGSGLLLIHNEKLLNLIDNWVLSLTEENFLSILPIVRRNFSDFSNAEKRQIGEIIKKTDKSETISNSEKIILGFSVERAKSILPVLSELLGIKN